MDSRSKNGSSSARRVSSIRVRNSEAPVLNFCANNYLGLSSHPRVVEAARQSLVDYGFGLSSVRFICGTQDAHKASGSEDRQFLETDDTILYSSCFDANGGLFETLLDESDAVISDALNHASIIDGVRLCKAERHRYAHGDIAALEDALKSTQCKRLRMIATDGVFSMDGDVAPLEGICDLADQYRALVMVDDSHATGFVGKRGRGSIEHCGVMGRVDIVTSTLGKALGGAAGGFPSGRREMVELLRQRSRPYLFSNTVAPADRRCELVRPRLALVDDGPQHKVMDNAKRFRDGMTAAGFLIKAGFHPIVPVMMTGPRSAGGADARLAQDVAAALLDEGIYVIGFSYPVVPKGQARIRVQLSAAHTPEMVDRAIDAFVRVGDSTGSYRRARVLICAGDGEDRRARDGRQRRDRAPAPSRRSPRTAATTSSRLDLTPLPDDCAAFVAASYAGNIMDRYLLDQLAAHHEIRRRLPPRRAALDARRARSGARAPGQRRGDAQRAAHGAEPVVALRPPGALRLPELDRRLRPAVARGEAPPSAACARSSGTCRSRCTAATSSTASTSVATSRSTRGSSARSPPRRASTSARCASRGSSRPRPCPPAARATSGPEMIHAAAQGGPTRASSSPRRRSRSWRCPTPSERSSTLAQADRERLSTCVYNIGAFSVSAGEIADRVRRAFPDAPHRVRARPRAREDRRLVAGGRRRRARPRRLGLAAAVRLGSRLRRVPRAWRARDVRAGLREGGRPAKRERRLRLLARSSNAIPLMASQPNHGVRTAWPQQSASYISFRMDESSRSAATR